MLLEKAQTKKACNNLTALFTNNINYPYYKLGLLYNTFKQ